MNKRNNNMKYNENDKVTMEPNLELERKQKSVEGNEQYNFVPSFNEWTSSDEQKSKVKEIENKTKKRVCKPKGH
ncbi:MAG: hypothetical protein N2749_07360 [Clostridia bacterium]|nr:hypothetical protein [Clostridia bacterium]